MTKYLQYLHSLLLSTPEFGGADGETIFVEKLPQKYLNNTTDLLLYSESYVTMIFHLPYQ